MNESAMIVEAVQAVQQEQALNAAQQVQAAPDPAAVEQFQAAMAPEAPQPIPFAEQVAQVWDSAQNGYQTSLHRIQALSEMTRTNGPNLAQLSLLQYEVANLSFQQEIVTNVAKKASDAVQTLIKNG